MVPDVRIFGNLQSSVGASELAGRRAREVHEGHVRVLTDLEGDACRLPL